MPKSQHQQPQDIQLYHKGVNLDDDQEILAASDKGWAVDAQNMRPTQINSHQGTFSKINGEEVLFPNVDNRCFGGTGQPIFGNYVNIGEVSVLNHIVEFWADEDNKQLPFVRIDGWVVLYPKLLSLFPLLATYPLQISTNDSCVGGEVCVTDFHIAPFVLNVEDMLINSGIDPATNKRDTVKYPCTQKYFDDFDISIYQVQLNRPVDHPIFVELVNAGSTINAIGRVETSGTGGMTAGSYQYSIRYINAAGDTALFSENTPLIPVPKGLSSASIAYPGSKTFGGVKGALTPYGIHIRFRVSNLLDFDQIEIKRTSFATGAAIGTLGIEEIVAQIDISSQEFSIIDFYDNDNTSVNVVTPEEVVDSMSSIEAAKAIRYYNSRLFLMNIKYESRDLTGKVVFDQVAGKEMFPFSSNLGTLGYKDIYNNVYRKSYFRGEKYGFASVFYDQNGARSFGLEIPNFTNEKMPERRDRMQGASLTHSTTLTGFQAYAQDSTPPFTSVNRTFEVFDLEGGVNKPIGGTTSSAVFPPPNILNILNAGTKDALSGSNYDRPFHPINDSDSDTTEQITQINPEVKIDGVSGFKSYSPKGFAPNIYSLGMALAGIKSMPKWVKAFTLVRTAPAKRVVAQGQSFYQLDDSHKDVEKNTNKVWWHSPDVYSQLVPFTSDIQPRLSVLNIQAVSALGFFSEVYSGRHLGNLVPVTKVSDGIDIVNYARIIEDHGNNINIDLLPDAISVKGLPIFGKKYVAFSSWRNTTLSGVDPNEVFAFAPSNGMIQAGRGSQHRSKPYQITFPSSIYATQGTSGDVFYKDTTVKNWHEPVYVMNIIDQNADVPSSNITEYFETGTYVKVESIVALSDGLTTSYYLVDERWEDCIPALKATDPTASQDRYVYIRDASNNAEEIWLNVTYKNAAQIATIQNDIATIGFYTSLRADGTSVSVRGMFTHTQSSNNRLFQIVFNQVDASGNVFLPLPSTQIIVKYDHNAPIDMFGGDAYIGDFNYCPVDAHLESSGIPALDPTAPADEVFFDRPMPYHEFHVTEQEFIIRNTTGANRLQDNNEIKLNSDSPTADNGRVRQQLVSGIVESRINTNLYYGSDFPQVNYVMRPYKWDTSSPLTNIHASYSTNYPNEENSWGYGGFKFLPSNNPDYSTLPVNLKHFSKPKVGFKENLHFCTQVLWSQKRPVNKSNAPGLLTFPPLNLYDIGDETGAIKFAWDGLAGSGTNIYAITEHGIAMLLTEKRLLTELSGSQLAAIGASEITVVQEAVWISKSIGMNDEWWRSAAEWDNTLYFTNRNSAYRLSGNDVKDIGRMTEGAKYYKRLREVINKVGVGYSTDVTSAYNIQDNEYWTQVCTHVKKIGYYTQAELGFPPLNLTAYLIGTPAPVPPPPSNTSITISQGQVISVVNDQIRKVDIRYLTSAGISEIVLCNNQNVSFTVQYDPTLTDPPAPPQTLVIINPNQCYKIYFDGQWKFELITLNLCAMPVWSEKTGGSWIGQFKHRFDRYTNIDNRMFGSRDIETWELNKGYMMNGKPIEAWTLQATVGGAQNLNSSKEFIRIRIAGDGQPQRVDFYDNIEQFETSAPTGTLNIATNPQFMLKDYGAYEQYVPRKTASPRNRQQGRLMLFKIMHNLASAFKIIDTSIMYKNLK